MKTKRGKSFTLKELLDLANEAYDDGFLANYYTKEGRVKNGSGDTLAKFIVIELIETFDPRANKHEQLEGAMDAIESAERQLNALMAQLQRVSDEIPYA